ncbi:hypothetical protein CAL18_06025 [Bordetella genomosp. 7]|jgi:hypothetical protein|uniref:DUF2848 domain-containing protein n=1 Tax=Bordetella genomosp. 7 TaxID=1416805 RepID=A0A261RBK5_9BORD|nr:DUF2848 domain-containing protein [Bordetella genomosp. 7]OZI22389.1 hypothetical protein CAL19_07560 [Bordetella genomosp. 7]OZI27092.1 hypothetical protein CAL18_06025 [Bordetella genomosp. 7]
MKAVFQVESDGATRTVETDIRSLVVAGWAGRDREAIEHHIEELAALGVPRPSSVPLYYRIAENQLTQASRIQVVGDASSGEVETFVFAAGGDMFVSIASDHTDRKLEAHSVALSKQVCAKPVGTTAWRLADVAEYWDELVVRAYIVENGAEVLYQEGPLATLRTPGELIAGYTQGQPLPEGTGMTCGTVAAIGGIRPSTTFIMELADPRRQRVLRHRYDVEVLPEVA